MRRILYLVLVLSLLLSVGMVLAPAQVQADTPTLVAESDTFCDGACSSGYSVCQMWGDDTHLYVLGGYYCDTLRKILKSDMSTVDELVFPDGTHSGIWGDDTYLYIGSESTYTVVKYLKSDLSPVAESSVVQYTNVIWGDSTHIYAAGNQGIVKKYLKSNMSYEGVTSYYGSSFLYGLWGDDTYIYTGGSGSPNTVKRYLKSNMSYVDETSEYSDVQAIWGDDDYIYTNVGYGEAIGKFLKTNMSYVDETPTYSSSIMAFRGDDDHIYAGGFTVNAVRKYLISDMSYAGQATSYGNTIYAVWVDDSYIYAGGKDPATVQKYTKISPEAPTGLLATPISSTEISLTWTQGANADYTDIYYKTGGYPANRTDGTRIYLGTGESYNHRGLTPGTTYYYRAWGYSSTMSMWSSGYDQDMATTLIGAGGGPDAPAVPPEWEQSPSCAPYENLPIYDLMIWSANGLEMPENTFCFGCTMIFIVIAGAIGYLGTRGSEEVLLAVIAVGIVAAAIAGALPLWMIVFAVILGAGTWYVWRRA